MSLPRQKSSRVKRRRSALSVLLLILVGSAVLRFGEGAGQAWAQVASPKEDAVSALSVPPLPNASGNDGCALPSSLAAALGEREARLVTQEAALSDRVAAVTMAEDALRGRLAQLEQAETALRNTLALADGAAEQDLSKLTSVYENMRVKDASVLFDAMEAKFAAGFLARMRSETAAAILGGMAPDKAYAVSAIVAGRNTSVPQN